MSVNLNKEALNPTIQLFLDKCAKNVEEDAKSRAPVDTGALRDSIVAEKDEITEFKYIIHDGVEYGVFQELGTSKIKAQPFLRPSLYDRTNYRG